MEPVRTPSQSVVIFIFLMITIFSFNNDETTSPSSYTEMYQGAEEWVIGTANTQSAHLQPGIQKKKASTTDADTLYHMVNYQAPKGLRSKFTNFVHPLGMAWPVR